MKERERSARVDKEVGGNSVTPASITPFHTNVVVVVVGYIYQ